MLEHIIEASKHNLLSGFIFSGTSKNDLLYGVWKDNHMPFGKIYDVKNYEKNFLLNEKNVWSTLLCLSKTEVEYLGIKILSMPLENFDYKKRIGLNTDALSILSKMCEKINKKCGQKIFEIN